MSRIKKHDREILSSEPKEKGFTLKFLMNQFFKGVYYTAGETISVTEDVFNAYKGQVKLKEFKQII